MGLGFRASFVQHLRFQDAVHSQPKRRFYMNSSNNQQYDQT